MDGAIIPPKRFNAFEDDMPVVQTTCCRFKYKRTVRFLHRNTPLSRATMILRDQHHICPGQTKPKRIPFQPIYRSGNTHLPTNTRPKQTREQKTTASLSSQHTQTHPTPSSRFVNRKTNPKVRCWADHDEGYQCQDTTDIPFTQRSPPLDLLETNDYENTSSNCRNHIPWDRFNTVKTTVRSLFTVDGTTVSVTFGYFSVLLHSGEVHGEGQHGRPTVVNDTQTVERKSKVITSNAKKLIRRVKMLL